MSSQPPDADKESSAAPTTLLKASYSKAVRILVEAGDTENLSAELDVLNGALDDAEKAALMAEAYRRKAEHLRSVAAKWREVLPGDPLYSLVSGRAEHEEVSAEQALAAARVYETWAASAGTKRRDL